MFTRFPQACRETAPGARGDIYFPSGLSPLAPREPRQPFVLEIRLGHLFTGNSRLRPYLFTDISRVKNRKYQSDYHRRGIGFAPLPVSTFLGVGREVCHLLHRLAHFKVDAVSPDAALPSGSSAYAGADGKIVFAQMLKELQYGMALASLVRLRGRDGFIDADLNILVGVWILFV